MAYCRNGGAQMKGSVLVTGGTGYLGQAIVKGLSGAGYSVAFTYRNNGDLAVELEHHLETSGVRGFALRLDLAEETDFESLLERVESKVGLLSSVILSASLFPRSSEEDENLAREIFRVNLEGPCLLATAAGRLFSRRGKGRILFVLDTAGEKIFPGLLAYSVSRAGGFALVRGLAKKFGPAVQVNAVSPGVIRDPEGMAPEEKEKLFRKIPAGRTGTVDEVVRTLLFLLEGPSYITGEVIGVDGGYGL
ncbi:MAG: SDR family oxidoreductase [Deltaproteobacteria bacterium]|nr:MAG: SDR family oxidoreductase [Deltaproteobacteria bacterium]